MPIKAFFKTCHAKFMALEEAAKYTNGGNRKKPGYEEVVDWIDRACLQIKSHTIVRSFQTTGLYHSCHKMNHLTYSNQLNHRLKKLLLIFEGTNYERSKDLAFLVSNQFERNHIELDNKIAEYIENYKDLAPSERKEEQEYLLFDEDILNEN